MGPSSRFSLKRQLLLWLLLPQIVLWLVAAFGAYRVASRHADELVDASLLQAARALARQIKPTASGLFVDLPRSAQDILSADPDDRVMYTVSSPPGQLLLGDARMPPPPGTLALMESAVLFDATPLGRDHAARGIGAAVMGMAEGLAALPPADKTIRSHRFTLLVYHGNR